MNKPEAPHISPNLQGQFTPGPWRSLRRYSHGFVWIESPTGYIACTEQHRIAGTFRSHQKHYEALANADLIAAAPELLEACKEALKYFELLDGPCEDTRKKWLLFKRAIAKAEGRE